MKIVANTQLLAAELRALNRVVPTKPTLPILSHAWLHAGADGIGFHVTDMEVSLTVPCPGNVEEEGSTAVPVAKLLQMVEQFPDGLVTLTAKGKYVTVECGSFTSKLSTLPVEDFPTQPAVEGDTVTIDAEALRRLIDKTRHALNAAGSKHVLKGSLLSFVGDSVAMISTDGKRLSLATATRQGTDLDVVVPAKAVDVLSGGTDLGPVELTQGPRHLFFSLGGRMLTSRRLEGKFPAYQNIVPKDNDKHVGFSNGHVAAALRRVVLTAEETSAVLMQIVDGRMQLSSTSAGVGSSSEFVDVDYAGEPLKVYVNGPYLLDFLNAATGHRIDMALKDAHGSALLTDGDHLGVIALMRT